MQSTPLTQKEFQEQYLGTFEIPKQSEPLTQFYRAYAGWLDDGAPDGVIFYRARGLCGNLRAWAAKVGLKIDTYKDMRSEMHNQFRSRYTDSLHPFNESLNEWNFEADSHTCHLNTNRVKWVRSHAE